jgi:omega-6 fatty acid desaturase (delta-12 desaturase)
MSIPSNPQRLRRALAAYQQPDNRRSILELLATIGPLAAFWSLGLVAARAGWLSAGLVSAILAAAFLVRLFMLQHDCGHGSFFRAKAANAWVGRIAGVLTMTPYDYWRRTHAIHHATSGNLDRRGLGAVETLTVEEYLALRPLRRLAYRIYRNPWIMFGTGPAYMFILQHRLPIGLMKDGRAWLSVGGVDLALALFLLFEILVAGAAGALLVHATIILIAGTIGMWLFYVQHQFEAGYWSRHADWTAHDAAVRGSSHLVLPPLLRWMTANIGAHHVHHLGSRIPFYRLPEVLRDHPELEACGRMTLRDSFRCANLALWDEARGRLIPFALCQRPSSDASSAARKPVHFATGAGRHSPRHSAPAPPAPSCAPLVATVHPSQTGLVIYPRVPRLTSLCPWTSSAAAQNWPPMCGLIVRAGPPDGPSVRPGLGAH